MSIRDNNPEIQESDNNDDSEFLEDVIALMEIHDIEFPKSNPNK